MVREGGRGWGGWGGGGVSNQCVCMYAAAKWAWVGIRKQLLLAE